MAEKVCRNGHLMGFEPYCTECGDIAASFDGRSRKELDREDKEELWIK